MHFKIVPVKSVCVFWCFVDCNHASFQADGGFIYSITADRQGNVYAAGRFTNAAGAYYVAKWNGHAWSELGSGFNALNANNDIFTVSVDELGNVYAAGFFTNASGKYYVAKWDGHSWSELGKGLTALNANGPINCLATDIGGNVYAGGSFMNSSNEYYLAKWNGTKWSETGSVVSALDANGAIQSVAINNKNEVYVAGYFTNGLRYYVAKWNQVSWSSVDNMQSSLPANDPIQSITVDANDNLYAGGKFLNKAGHSFVAQWNKTGWNEMGGEGDPFYSNQPIYQIAAHSTDEVYVSGYFLDNGGRYYLEHWNGSGWQQLSVPDTSGLNLYISSTANSGKSHQMVADKQGNLYVTGWHTISLDNNYPCVLKWDGVKWSILEDFPNSLNAINNSPAYKGVTKIEMDRQGNIYVAGSFNDSAYGSCSLVKWDGKTWSRLPGSRADYIQDFCVTGDGNIYAFGGFEDKIAQYNAAKNIYWQEVRNGNSRLIVPGSNVFMALATDTSNNLYVTGDFTNSAGKRYFPKWDGKSWSEFGIANALGKVLTIDQKNNIYATDGAGAIVGGVITRWNGTSWVSIGVSVGTNDVYPIGSLLATDPAGNVYTDAENGNGGSFIAKFNVTPTHRPALIGFVPAIGSMGTAVTIKGKNLTGTAIVTFGGTKAASFTVQNDSTITAVVANGSTGIIRVQTIGGADSIGTFVYTCDSVKGPVPSISLAGDSLLLSSYANHYQWYYNNHKLTNRISDSVHIAGSGFYRVETSEDKVCWVPSPDYPVLISRTSPDSLQLSVYPNPSHGNFTAYVKLPKITTVKAYVQVTDVNGVQILQTSKLIFYGNQIRIPVSINAKGSFFVKVFVNDDAVQRSIIIL